MNKRWAVREKPDNADVKKLADELTIDTVLSTLLIHRGITNYEDARYLNAHIQNLHICISAHLHIFIYLLF